MRLDSQHSLAVPAAPPAASALETRLAAALPTAAARHARARFDADLGTLELRITMIDARFERLACRPAEAYARWRDDTAARMRHVAAHAGELDRDGGLEPEERRRIAAALTTLRHALGRLDRRHAAWTQQREGSGRPR